MTAQAEISPARQAAGNCLRVVANKLSEFRLHFAEVIVEEIDGGDFESWRLVRHVGLAALTDVADGVFGRFSNELLAEPPSEEHSRMDGDADKKMQNETQAALARVAFGRGYTEYGGALQELHEANTARDERVLAARDEVKVINDTLDEDQKLSSSANKWGQAKTWVNSFALGVAVSPWAKRRWGRRLATRLYKTGVKMALRSEAGIMKKIESQKQMVEDMARVSDLGL